MNNMAMVWSAYHCVHGTSCYSSYTLSAMRIHCSRPYRFLLFMETCFSSFLIVLYKYNNNNQSHTCTMVMIIAFLHGLIDTCSVKMASIAWQHIASRSTKNAQCILQFRFKLSTKRPSLGKFFTIDGCFNCVTSRDKALGWLKRKKERKKEKKKKERKNLFSFQI